MNEALRERAKEFEREHGCGSIGRCVQCMAAFAAKECQELLDAARAVADYGSCELLAELIERLEKAVEEAEK